MARAADAPQPPPRSLESGTRIGAVVSQYHRAVTTAMLESARDELARCGLEDGDLLVVDAPGAYELPLLARQLGLREDVHAVLCLGLVLKGETSHDQHIASAVAHALQQVSLQCDKPILFGVLTCNDLEQARARALRAEQGGKYDKGREVARAAVDALAAQRAARDIGSKRAAMGFAKPRGAKEPA